MTKYIVRGDQFRITADSNLIVKDKLPVGTYTVYFDELASEFFLKPIEAYTLGKLYGDVAKRADRIMSTFISRASSTGVLLSGEKGTGKTMLAKLLSLNGHAKNIPTIVINEDHHGEPFNRFIQSIDQPCIIIFDEFEKVYHHNEAQEAMLTLLDGVYPTKKLFILTTNDRYSINRHMLNRPGRLFYHIEYRGLSDDFIREYCLDNLNNIENIEGVIKVASIFEEFNFDMLKALVEEMNRYNETAADSMYLMNIKPESSSGEFEVSLTIGGKTPAVISEEEMILDTSKPFRVYYYMTKKSSDEGKRITFNPSHLVGMAKGRLTFRNGNAEVILTKKPSKSSKMALVL